MAIGTGCGRLIFSLCLRSGLQASGQTSMGGTADHKSQLSGRPGRMWPAWLVLFFIVLAGAALRLYRIQDVSFWYDDYNTVMGLKADELTTYLAAIHFISPDHAPAYFLVLFLWSKVMGASLIAGRLLSVLCGTAAIPLLYLLCKRQYGARAALIAALCMAISPMHLWYAQAIRYNALTEPLTLVSIMSFLGILQEGRKRWWCGNAAANIALFWIHPLTLLLPFVQLLTLFLFAANRLRWILAWGLVQFLCLLPLIHWLLQSAPYTVSYEEDVYAFSWMTLLVDWLVDDAVTLSQAWMFHTHTCSCIPDSPYTMAGFLKGYGLFNLAMLVVFGACLLLFLAGTARAWWRCWRGRGDASARQRGIAGVFLLTVHTLPLLVLVGLSYAFRPVLMPHYTLYSTFTTYIAVGVVLGALRSHYLRLAGVAVTVAVFGYQTALVMHEQTRFDWSGAARYVEKNAATDEPVLVRGRFFAAETFRIALGPAERPILPAYTLEAICEKAGRHLPLLSPPSVRSFRVWAVVEMQFDSPPLPLDRLEAGLRSRGLRFTAAFFPGMGGITVYGIERDPAAPCVRPEAQPCSDYDCARLLGEMGLPGAAGAEAGQDAIARLRHIVETDWPRGAYTFAQFSIALSDEGCAELAEAAALKSIALRPDSSLGQFALSLALAEKGEMERAGDAFAKAVERDRIGFFRLYQPLFRAAYEINDAGLARAEIKKLDSIDLYVPQVFRVRAGSPREAPPPRLCGP